MKNFKDAAILLGLVALTAAVSYFTGHVVEPAGAAVLAVVVQSAYSERQPIGLAGQIADMTNYDADSLIVENSNGAGFGLAVSQGTLYNQCVLGATAAAKFRGVTIRDITLAPVAADSDYVDEYPQRALAGVLTRGDIWVLPGGNVSPGNDVTFNSTTGVFSSAGASGTQFAVAGARWMTTGSTVLVAKLRLSGHVPSA